MDQKKELLEKQKWMTTFQKAVLKDLPKGRINWGIATYLYDNENSATDSAKEYINNIKGKKTTLTKRKLIKDLSLNMKALEDQIKGLNSTIKTQPLLNVKEITSLEQYLMRILKPLKTIESKILKINTSLLQKPES